MKLSSLILIALFSSTALAKNLTRGGYAVASYSDGAFYVSAALERLKPVVDAATNSGDQTEEELAELCKVRESVFNSLDNVSYTGHGRRETVPDKLDSFFFDAVTELRAVECNDFAADLGHLWNAKMALEAYTLLASPAAVSSVD